MEVAEVVAEVEEVAGGGDGGGAPSLARRPPKLSELLGLSSGAVGAAARRQSVAQVAVVVIEAVACGVAADAAVDALAARRAVELPHRTARAVHPFGRVGPGLLLLQEDEALPDEAVQDLAVGDPILGDTRERGLDVAELTVRGERWAVSGGRCVVCGRCAWDARAAAGGTCEGHSVLAYHTPNGCMSQPTHVSQ